MSTPKTTVNPIRTLTLFYVWTLCVKTLICEEEWGTCEDKNVKQETPYFSEGGWITHPSDLVAQPGPCNIDIKDSTLTQREFLHSYAYIRPLILRDVSNNAAFRSLVRRDPLLSSLGHSSIKLSSANTYSYEKRVVTLADYAENYIGPQRLDTPGNETFFLFGDHDYEEFSELFGTYNPPPYRLPGHSGAFSFGLAGPGSGVPMHFHGPGFAETLYGRKRWFLTAPNDIPEFHPNKTTLQWLLQDYPSVKEKMTIHECTLRPGEVLYFPDKWWHATLNIDTAVFMSTFLSP